MELLKTDIKNLATIRIYDTHKKLLKEKFGSLQKAIDYFIEKEIKKEKRNGTKAKNS